MARNGLHVYGPLGSGKERRSIAMEPVLRCIYPYTSMCQGVGLEVEGRQDSSGPRTQRMSGQTQHIAH
jgi:hypothetical protein